MLDVPAIRKDFPILERTVHGHPLVYLDNGATTQVPEAVVARIAEHYRTGNANVHRGTHFLAHASTERLEEARRRVARFVGAANDNCIVFTKGTTDAVNMVASGLRHAIGPGDRVVATILEHHSNYVPWQQLCLEHGAQFEVAQINEQGDLDLAALERLLRGGVKLVAVTGCSNVLGTVTPIEHIVQMAHDAGALCLVDGAQAMRHRVMDMQAIGCDFLCFSGHKLMAPTGIGALCGTPKALEMLAPCEFGGEMVDAVAQECTTFADLPLRLEAGTPNYVGAIALAEALDYLEGVGRENAAAYEDELVSHAEQALSAIAGVHVLGNPELRSGCVSFTVDNVHPFDLCSLADKLGLALRSGNNCAQPLLAELGLTSVARLSPAFYNTHDEIDCAAQIVERVVPLVQQG